MMKTDKLVVGIVAHVDAGKTTLVESILYTCGAIRKLGRVDHQDAFLDTFPLEKQRGITIFSKQAELELNGRSVTLLDTPGHVDFSAEMERTLQVLDYAILVINGSDGVRGYTITLWNLLRRYQIPTFIFINKMDMEGTNSEDIMTQLQSKLDAGCLDFGRQDTAFFESLAMCDELFLEQYLEDGRCEIEDVRRLIKKRVVFPCYFGSALRMEGVGEFIHGLRQYIGEQIYPEEFGAKVYKISRDARGTRLTHLKITGGELKVKKPLTGMDRNNQAWEEKIDQIRIYSGEQYQAINKAVAGSICAVTGLEHTYAGAGIGIEQKADEPVLEPVLTYCLSLSSGGDVYGIYEKLCQLEEEEPGLHISQNFSKDKTVDGIRIQVMGEVQIEILKSLILERFGAHVEFSEGRIVYKETIAETVEGMGHFEPLKHYAEVHLVLEPAEAGTGISLFTDCSEDMLSRNWQRLILTHLQEKRHKGVLTGSELTDVKITLIAGKAHKKHTDGGDFRQATYRAVRQGLRKAESILLEPVYDYVLEIPADKVGRALSDIQRMSGTCLPPDIQGDRAVIHGSGPVATMSHYQTEVAAYTRGEGQIFYTLKGYEPCHNEEEIIAIIGYDPDKDVENPSSSVFFSHGSGFVVEWDQVEEYMHIERKKDQDTAYIPQHGQDIAEKSQKKSKDSYNNEKELEEIFVRTYGPIDRKRTFHKQTAPVAQKADKPYVYKERKKVEEYLLVDGYNIIFAWEELKELAAVNIAAARDRLCEILCNYQGYKENTVILVFDAYKVKDYGGEIQQYKNIFIVYTKTAETADQYIEKTVKKISKNYNVTVATSDTMEQMIIWGLGALRFSAQDLKQEIDRINHEMKSDYLDKKEKLNNYISVEGLEDDL